MRHKRKKKKDYVVSPIGNIQRKEKMKKFKAKLHPDTVIIENPGISHEIPHQWREETFNYFDREGFMQAHRRTKLFLENAVRNKSGLLKCEDAEEANFFYKQAQGLLIDDYSNPFRVTIVREKDVNIFTVRHVEKFEFSDDEN